ncbi:fungal-specific transcription factor domain-containing protein [Aspergillus pseudoustus]|uniref:Fungal-specific transcription factor domain-containing protein n=1 Tax=Aspergillus pseudoustus TaxID=1810923 RepID=A0ABR4IMQ9_9EURO
MQSPKLNKSCDQCRSRKVRCIVPLNSSGGRRPVACTHCVKRNETCQFSNLKRRLRAKGSSTPQASSDPFRPSTDLFIDRLISNPSESAVLYDEFSVLKAHDDRVPSSGVAFFSAKRVDSLVKRLGNTHLRELVHQIDKTIRTRLLARPEKEISLYSLAKAPAELELDPDAASHIQRYFEVLHPVYPFLDRLAFEEKATSADLLVLLETEYAFCGLYYAVLALGCQYNGLGSFMPDNNRAWEFFQMALGRLDQILMSPESLANLQAVTAMALFATSAFGHSLDQTLVAEASRMAITLRYHKSVLDENSTLCHRIFWVVYHLEKRYCFQARQSSSIADYDIGCPIPAASDAVIGEYNWLLSSVRFSRILSLAYASLFSVSASTQPDNALLTFIDHVHTLLEEWRTSVPLEFRPKEPLQRRRLIDGASKEIALRTHYYYYHLVIALSRLTLHVSHEVARSENAMRALLDTARSVIDLTRFIDVEPYTPTFILAILPLSALFILFDFVIHHPADPDIRSYLTLLDIVAGHFSQLDHASGGAIPSSYLSEFSHMAREYVQSGPARQVAPTTTGLGIPSSSGQGVGGGGVLEPSIGVYPSASHTHAHTPTATAAVATEAMLTDNSLPSLRMGEPSDTPLMNGVDYNSLDSLYFLTPDSDFWAAGHSFEEFDPREFYGEIFL